MSEMFKEASCNTFNSASFTNNTVITGTQNETDLLLQHCALAALLDSKERMDPAKCHPKTREAVMEEIVAWIEDSNPDASMMIMHGPVGSGKSALAQSIAEHYKLQQRLAAAFFFSRTAPGRNNGHSLIPTILYQLISSHPELRLPIRMRLWREPTLLQKSIQIVMEDLFIASFFSWIYIVLCWITGNPLFSWAFGWVHPRLIVIDGLDECADNEVQSHILGAAATATGRLRRSLRILIACRPEIHILQTLGKLTISNYAELDLGACNASHDIQLFLSDKFAELKQHHPLAKRGRLPTSWPGPDIIATVTENASGQFIYAKVIMAYIESPKHSPVDRLNIILGSSPKPDGDKPFAMLDALYKNILSSVENDLLMRQILGFMAIPRMEGDGLGQYTTPIMISQLLSPPSIDSVFLILEQLRSIIKSTAPDEPIQFWHASTSDFLLGKERSTEFFVDVKMAHETLARGYLRLFQIQPPDRFQKSSFFSPFLEHCKMALLSKRLEEELVAYDLFSAYKAAVGEPITLGKVRDAWQSGRVPNLFSTLALRSQGHSIVNIYLDSLYRNYPLEPCIKESLKSFLDPKKFKRNKAALYQALYVPLLHCLLNGGDAATANSLAEKSIIGILTTYSEATNHPLQELGGRERLRSQLANFSGISYPGMSRSEFNLACNDCLSILLPHASHYSKELVNILLEQQRGTLSLSEIYVKAAMVVPYLEQFEDHIDASPELRVFLEKYRASKCPSVEIGDGSMIGISSGDISLQVST